MKDLRFFAALLCTVATGCANGFSGARPLTYQEPGETRLYVSYSNCPNFVPVGQNLAPVFAGIAMSAASELLSQFGTALAEGAKGGDLPASVAMTNFELRPDRAPRCLIVIRGDFDKNGNESKVALPRRAALQVEGVSEENKLEEGNSDEDNTKEVGPIVLVKPNGDAYSIGLPDTYDLQHYIELQLLPSSDKSALTFAPVAVQVARSMDGSNEGKRDLSIAVQFKRPSNDPVGSAARVTGTDIGAPKFFTQDPQSGRFINEAVWFSGIQFKPADTFGDDAGQANSLRNGKDGAASGKGSTDSAAVTSTDANKAASSTTGGGGKATGGVPSKPVGGVTGSVGTQIGGDENRNLIARPYTATITVVETRPTNQALAFVATVFGGAVKPVIESKLKNAIDKETIAGNYKTSAAADAAYAGVLGGAYAAIEEYCAIGTQQSLKGQRFQKSGAARKAQIEANQAAYVADIVRSPFATLIAVSGDPPKTTNPSHCK